MATRFSVSLAHAGCDHTGFVVWEERDRADARGAGNPVMVSLPRGFVSLNGDDGSIEIVCAGCRQTVASAARVDPPMSAVAAEPEVAATLAAPVVATAAIEPAVSSNAPETAGDPDVGETASVPTPDKLSPVEVAPAEVAPAEAAQVDVPPGDATPGDATTEDKTRADIEALFAEADDVAPIRGDSIPPHLLDKLRHLADRMRQRRE